MIKKILVAYDMERQAQASLETAVAIAKNEQSEITIITSIKVPDYVLRNLSLSSKPGAVKNVDKIIRADYEKKLDLAAEQVKKEGIPVKTILTEGSPGEAIIDFSAQEHADLIIVGSHNRKGLSKAVLGSVSSYVVQNANCAVMIIKAQ